MNTSLSQKIEQYLRHYAVMLDYWRPDEGDTHLMADYRELLNDNVSALTDSQQHMLTLLDERAQKLLDSYGGPETWDVKMLRDVVAISHPECRRAA